MTTKDRQERYRARRRADGDKRLSIWITRDVADVLSEMANTYAVTQKQILERLLLIAGKNIITKDGIKSLTS